MKKTSLPKAPNLKTPSLAISRTTLRTLTVGQLAFAAGGNPRPPTREETTEGQQGTCD